MRRAKVYNHNILSGELIEIEKNKSYQFVYSKEYSEDPISLTIPLDKREYFFDEFPSFFEGLLPEGVMLDNLLRTAKIDENDLFSQLVYVGQDLVGSLTIEEII